METVEKYIVVWPNGITVVYGEKDLAMANVGKNSKGKVFKICVDFPEPEPTCDYSITEVK